MNRLLLLICIGWLCVCLVAASGCGSDEEGPPTSPEATAPDGTVPPQTPGERTPAGDSISARGEEVERIANTALQNVTWEDGATYEETVADLVFRTADLPDAGRGYRTVARWLGDSDWLVTIFMRVVDRSTQPATSSDLRGEFYYDEDSGEFTAANGRGEFALTGSDPCPTPTAESELCPLDKETEVP